MWISDKIPSNAEFLSSSMLVRGDPKIHFFDLLIDSVPVIAALDHIANGLLTAPHLCMRGSLPHAVEVVPNLGGVEMTLRDEVQSHNVSYLQGTDDHASGSIYDTVKLYNRVVLYVVLDDVTIGTCGTWIERPDVTVVVYAGAYPGFVIHLQLPRSTDPFPLSLFVTITNFAALGSTIICGVVSNVADDCPFSDAAQALFCVLMRERPEQAKSATARVLVTASQEYRVTADRKAKLDYVEAVVADQRVRHRHEETASFTLTARLTGVSRERDALRDRLADVESRCAGLYVALEEKARDLDPNIRSRS